MATIPTGKFVWFEYLSNDERKAQAFFGELFHRLRRVPMNREGALLRHDPHVGPWSQDRDRVFVLGIISSCGHAVPGFQDGVRKVFRHTRAARIYNGV